MSKVHRRVTYRLYPSATQNVALRAMLEAHRELYNAALLERRDAWRKSRASIGFAAQCKSWTQIRGEHPEYRAINAQSGQVTLKRLQRAFENFFRRVKEGEEPGYPRFKSKSRFPGWGYKSHGDGFRFTPGKNFRHGTLRLSGIGTVKARGVARVSGDVVSCDIKRDATGWLLSVVFDCDPQRAPCGSLEAGLDWGVETFVTLAYAPGDYARHDNDRLGQAATERLGDERRALARATRGKSKRKRKFVLGCLARRQRKLANQRKDRVNKLTARLASAHRKASHQEYDGFRSRHSRKAWSPRCTKSRG